MTNHGHTSNQLWPSMFAPPAAGALQRLMASLVIFDVDGTLVDSNYQHALAWSCAFREHGCVLPLWRIHRANGMGGDKVVAHLGGDDLERRLGESIRAAEGRAYAELIDQVAPLEGALELLIDLKARGFAVVLATSAKEEELDHYLDLLEVRGVVDGWTTSADVAETKPEPDVVRAALAKGGGGSAVMVGDTTWDVIAAARAGLPTVCLTTGGFAAQELDEAGAVAVFDSLPNLHAGTARTPIGA